MYASPIARFLSSCDRLSIDWRRLEWEALRAYRDQLAREVLEQGVSGKPPLCTAIRAALSTSVSWEPPLMPAASAVCPGRAQKVGGLVGEGGMRRWVDAA